MRSNIWQGSLSFGLINIPVSLQTAVEDQDLHFNLLDKRNLSRIKFNRVNEKTGQTVSQDQIVKGYEFKKGKYVVMTDRDFEDANPKANKMIDIETFVNLGDVDPLYFEKPYYLVPEKGAQKSYNLLREALTESYKAAVAKFVLHTKEHLTCIFAREKFLVLEILRFPHNIKNPEKVESLKSLTLTKSKPQELKMAQRLIDDMTGKWDPKKYKDTYYDDLMKHIQKRAAAGNLKKISPPEEHRVPLAKAAQSKDLMELLRASLRHEISH